MVARFDEGELSDVHGVASTYSLSLGEKVSSEEISVSWVYQGVSHCWRSTVQVVSYNVLNIMELKSVRIFRCPFGRTPVLDNFISDETSTLGSVLRSSST